MLLLLQLFSTTELAQTLTLPVPENWTVFTTVNCCCYKIIYCIYSTRWIPYSL